MKKFFACFAIIAILSSFTSAVVPTHEIDLGYTCSKYEPVAVGKVKISGSGTMVNYEINYCSAAFETKERYIKFTLTFVDKDGKILKEASTGAVLTGAKSGVHIAGAAVTGTVSDCFLEWSYMDITVDENQWEDVEGSDGTQKFRDTRNDPEYIFCHIRSLRLSRK